MEKYDRRIETIDGTIGLIERFDFDSGENYYDCYLNDKFVCEADYNADNKKIEDLVLQ